MLVFYYIKGMKYDILNVPEIGKMLCKTRLPVLAAVLLGIRPTGTGEMQYICIFRLKNT